MIKRIIDYLVFSGISATFGFIGLVYMTRTIKPEELGIIGLFMAIMYVFPQVISFSTLALVSINKVKLSSEKFLEFSNVYFTFGIINFLFIMILSFGISFFFKEYYLIFILLPLWAFIQFFSNFHQAELVQEGLSRKYGIYRLLISIILLGLTIFFISFLNLTWEGRLFALVLAETTVLYISLKVSFSTLKQFKFKFNLSEFKELALFGLPLFIGLGAGWLLNQADRFIILEFFTLADVGLYTAAYIVGVTINMINQAVSNAILPSLYNSLEVKKGYEVVGKINLYYSLAIISIALFIGISSYWYVPFLFGEEYLESSSVIFFISLAFAFNGIYRVSGAVIAFYKKNKLQMKLIYFVAGINVLFSIILVPWFDILAPAIGTLIAYIVLAYLSYIYSWDLLKVEELNEKASY